MNGESHKDCFQLETDFGSKETLYFELGRLSIGRNAGVLRLLMAPDGVHVLIPLSCKSKFVHEYDDGEMVVVGFPKATDPKKAPEAAPKKKWQKGAK